MQPVRSLVACRFELYLSAKDPVNDSRIGQYKRKTNSCNDQNIPERRFRRRGIVQSETVFRHGIGIDNIGIHPDTKKGK